MHDSEKWKWSRSVVSDCLKPHGLQAPRLLRPWDFPGKSTGVGCHCLLWPQTLVHVKVHLGRNFSQDPDNTSVDKINLSVWTSCPQSRSQGQPLHSHSALWHWGVSSPLTVRRCRPGQSTAGTGWVHILTQASSRAPLTWVCCPGLLSSLSTTVCSSNAPWGHYLLIKSWQTPVWNTIKTLKAQLSSLKIETIPGFHSNPLGSGCQCGSYQKACGPLSVGFHENLLMSEAQLKSCHLNVDKCPPFLIHSWALITHFSLIFSLSLFFFLVS